MIVFLGRKKTTTKHKHKLEATSLRRELEMRGNKKSPPVCIPRATRGLALEISRRATSLCAGQGEQGEERTEGGTERRGRESVCVRVRARTGNFPNHRLSV